MRPRCDSTMVTKEVFAIGSAAQARGPRDSFLMAAINSSRSASETPKPKEFKHDHVQASQMPGSMDGLQ